MSLSLFLFLFFQLCLLILRFPQPPSYQNRLFKVKGILSHSARMFTSSANSLHTNSWLEEWRKIMQSESAEIPSVTRNRLLEPLKLSDPVFCSALCQELVSTANITVIFNVLCDPNPSKVPIRTTPLMRSRDEFYSAKFCSIYVNAPLPRVDFLLLALCQPYFGSSG